jgi:hypothetical protein
VEKSDTIYSRLVDITRIYLGPAAERFIDRQVHNHLKKEPVDISQNDVGKLIDWIRSSVSLLTENEQLIEEYMDRLMQLSKSKGEVKVSSESER